MEEDNPRPRWLVGLSQPPLPPSLPSRRCLRYLWVAGPRLSGTSIGVLRGALSRHALIAVLSTEGPGDLAAMLCVPDAHVTNAFQASTPWIVAVTDNEDPVVFLQYAAEHATGAAPRHPDFHRPPPPGLVGVLVALRVLQPFNPGRNT